MQPVNNIQENQTNAGVFHLEKGKIPPQAIDLEVAVIGACLINFRDFKWQ